MLTKYVSIQFGVFILLIILFLPSPFLAKAQEANAPDIIWHKCVELYKEGKLDSAKVKVFIFRDNFHLYDSGRQLYTCLDTLKYRDGYFAIGVTILDPYMEFDGERIGNWTYYYPTGKIFSKGNFGVGAYTECQAGGPNLMGYSFKIGQWSYWYDNGQLMTSGIYRPGRTSIQTECGVDSVYISGAERSWIYYDSAGNEASDKGSIIQNINSFR